MADRSTLRRRTKGTRHDANGQAGGVAKTAEPESTGFNLDAVYGFLSILSLVFGGCCTNVWAFEKLLNQSAKLGSTITFCQMLFVTLSSLPAFLTWPRLKDGRTPSFPVLKPRQVPLTTWMSQVLVLTTGSLLNNWAFAYDVPLTLQIVFRSSGLPVSMIFGVFFLKRHYSGIQILSVLLVTVGVILATLSRPSTSSESATSGDSQYFIGIGMLTISLVLTGILGILQEKTYRTYGPCWREGLFYTHVLSLPMFALFLGDVSQGFRVLSQSPATYRQIPLPLIYLSLNLFTQLICVSGVNQLTSRVTSVSTNLVLTTRKAVSLLLSVWLFGNGWNTELATGASMVFAGSVLYTLASSMQ